MKIVDKRNNKQLFKKKKIIMINKNFLKKINKIKKIIIQKILLNKSKMIIYTYQIKKTYNLI